MTRSLNSTRLWTATAAAALSLLAVSCSSDPDSSDPDSSDSNASTSDPSNSGSADAGEAHTQAQEVVAEALQRNQTPPDLGSNPAAEGKKLAIISFAQSNESGVVPSEAAQAAAEAIGWEATIYDAKSNVGAITGLVRQAQATDADAIILVNIDCAFAAEAFADAKAAGVVIVPINGFDCDNAGSPGGPGSSGFSGSIIPGGELSPDDFWKQNGSDLAYYAIADSNNAAKIISVQSDGLAVEYWQHHGFEEAIEASGGSQIVETVDFTTADFVSGKLTTMVESALAQNPDATYIKSPFSAATIANVIPAIRASHSDIKVLGGEGLQSEFDLIRSDQAVATVTTPGEWSGWAAVDTVNSLLQGAEPQSSGLQWMMVTKDNLPSSGSGIEAADFEAAYLESWGISQ